MLKVGFILLGLSVVLFVISACISYQVDKKLKQYDVIKTEEGLRNLLDGPKNTYVLMNMELTGEPCRDRLGILEDESAGIIAALWLLASFSCVIVFIVGIVFKIKDGIKKLIGRKD